MGKMKTREFWRISSRTEKLEELMKNHMLDVGDAVKREGRPNGHYLEAEVKSLYNPEGKFIGVHVLLTYDASMPESEIEGIYRTICSTIPKQSDADTSYTDSPLNAQ